MGGLRDHILVPLLSQHHFCEPFGACLVVKNSLESKMGDGLVLKTHPNRTWSPQGPQTLADFRKIEPKCHPRMPKQNPRNPQTDIWADPRTMEMHAKHNRTVILVVLGRQLILLKYCCMHAKHNRTSTKPRDKTHEIYRKLALK